MDHDVKFYWCPICEMDHDVEFDIYDPLQFFLDVENWTNGKPVS